MSLKLVLVALAVLATVAVAEQLKWTGYAHNNQWNTKINWYPDSVPGPDDDVLIPAGTVEVTSDVAIKSLTMGTSFHGKATLKIYQSFAIEKTMTVENNGVLVLNSGTASLSGNVGVSGVMQLLSGSLLGQVAVSGTLDMTGGAQKTLNGASLVNSGTANVSGVVVMNQSSVFTNTGKMTVSDFTQVMNGDDTPSQFDSRKGVLTVQGNDQTFSVMTIASFGTINYLSGEMQMFKIGTFSSDLVVPQGSTLSTLGMANVSFQGALSGQGKVSVAGFNSSFVAVTINELDVVGGNTFFNAGVVSNIVKIDGGMANFNAAVSGTSVSLGGGILVGAGGLTATSKASLASPGLNLNTVFTVGEQATMRVENKSVVAFQPNGNMVIDMGAVVTVDAETTLSGAPGTPGVTNNGNIFVTASITSINVDITGRGNATVSGAIAISGNKVHMTTMKLDGGVFSGTNSMLAVERVESAKPTGHVHATFGKYVMECPGHCEALHTTNTTSDQFSLSTNL